MPSLDTFAEYFPTYATGVVLVLLGIIIGGLVERYPRKRLEKYIDERFALNEEYLVEALEEYRHPLYEVELAPPDAYEPGTFTLEERFEEYRGGSDAPMGRF